VIAWLTSLLRRIGALLGAGRSAHNDDFDPELREVFFAELEDVTQLLQHAFAAWRANAADQAAMQNLRRGFHTIKGSALMVGAAALGEFCRHLEQLSIRLMEQQVKVTPAMVVTIEQAIALLPAFAKTVSDGRAPPAQSHAIANRVQRMLA
jgi:chemosensory pili system protein ChpA (sensor histidine kinase/response regulator)